MKKRASGVLLHITSLPSASGIGDLGPEAYSFVDFLGSCGQSYWQVLPLNPTIETHNNSPYSSISSFAGNTLLISPELLVRDGFLEREDIKGAPEFPENRVDYSKVTGWKERLLSMAWTRKKGKTVTDCAYEEFIKGNEYWLEDYVLFKALKSRHGDIHWNSWPGGLDSRTPEAIRKARQEMSEEIEKEKFFQYLFHRQWDALVSYCGGRGVKIIGDMPIYVNYDSAEVWTNPGFFKLGPDRRPEFVAGVPPDYFSSTGQMWGNPVYDWDALKKTGYAWWVMKMKRAFSLYDIVRIDHFRGLVKYWEVPAHDKDASGGKWADVPAEDFFNTLLRFFPYFPVIAEDLGYITPDVHELVRKLGFPGMKVLIFAFGEENPNHIYLPHTYEPNYVAYTTTHDTNTAAGWFENEATVEQKKRAMNYMGIEDARRELHWEMIRLLMMSPALLVVTPAQDLLGLGTEARMNKPSTNAGNWEWRLEKKNIPREVSRKLLKMTYTYGRM